MALTKLKVTAALLLAVSLFVGGVGALAHRAPAVEQRTVQHKQGPKQFSEAMTRAKADAEKPRPTDRYGDALPIGAVARFGTLRWRALGEVEALAFAPDGKVLASASPSGESPVRGLCLFDVASGKRTKHISPSDTFFRRIAFSPEGTRLACICTVQADNREKNTVQIWELSQERKIHEFEAEHLRWLGWSADAQPLAVLQGEGVIILRELAIGKERRFKAENLPDARGLKTWAYADRGRILAVPDDERLVIHIWDTAAGEKRYAFQAKGDRFLGLLALSLDGRLLASLTQDAIGTYYVQLWDVAGGKATHRVAADQKYVGGVAFSPDGKTLATVGWNDVRCWDVTTGRERSRAQGVQSFAPSVAFSPDGKTLATAERYSGAIHLWDVATGALKPQPLGHTNAPHQVVFSPDGRRVASGGGMDDTIFVWDPTIGDSFAQVRPGGGSLHGFALSANGQSLYSWRTSDRLEFGDVATGRELYTVKLDDPDRPDTKQSGSYMHLSDDGKTLIAISSYSPKKGGGVIPELLVTGWDTATRKQLFRRSRTRVDFGMAVSPDGRVLAAAQGRGNEKPAGQGPIRLEDLATGEELVTLPVLERQTRPLAFSPDSRLLTTNTLGPAPPGMAGGPDENAHTLRLWEVTTAAELLALPTVINSCVAFSPDGRVLAMSAPSQEILLWDLRRGKELRRIRGFDADVTSLAFSPDGSRLVSGLSDSTLLVWDLAATRKAGKPGGIEAVDPAQAWADLGADAPKAFAARAVLAEVPEKAVSLLKERVKPVQVVDVGRLRRLLADLNSDRFAVRDEARKGLEEMGELAVETMRQTLADKPTLEVRQRIEALFEKLRGRPITRLETLRALRAVAVLEDIATPEARQVLETLARGAPQARLTQDAKASLDHLAKRADPSR